MTFSVTIPAYKPAFLYEAVASIVAQTFPGWELIVVDDCSPFDLQAIVAPFLSDPRVHYYRNDRNIGAIDLVDNWNRCLAYCRGDYVICMGDDDRLLPQCLEDLVELIGNYPDLGIYHVQTQMIDGSGALIESLPVRPEFECALDLLERRWKKNSRQYIGDFCFEISQLRAEGGFFKLPQAWCSDDISSFRAAAYKGIANTSRPGFQYRQTSLSISSNENFIGKIEALAMASDWFEDALSVFPPSSDREAVLLRKLRTIRRPYFKYLSGEYLKSDIGKRPARLFYWIAHRKDCRLNVPRILYQAVKGIILNKMDKLR